MANLIGREPEEKANDYEHIKGKEVDYKGHITLQPAFGDCLKAELKEVDIGLVSNGYITPMAGANLRLLHVNKIREYRARVQTVGVIYDIDDEFGQYIPNFAKIALPLAELTKKKVPNEIPWSKEAENAQGVEDSTMWNYRLAGPEHETVLHAYGCFSDGGRMLSRSIGWRRQHSSP
ncbi:hypothetical protein TNCV_2540641 [Trichonephila clavipes]|nr:hypothetical protein TNCV_2540641 [Trichonephila clavipes]